MRFKTWILIALSLLLVMGGYLAFNPSYERSLEAKFYYTVGEYGQAHTLATEAFALDPYNRMASTVMSQSERAMAYVNYIAQAKSYMEQISALAGADSVGEADRARIKLICEIMIESYSKITPTVLTDEALIKESRYYYERFVQLHEKVTQPL